MAQAQIYHIPLPELPGLEQTAVTVKWRWKKPTGSFGTGDYVKQILQYRPEAVYVEGDVFSAYPVVHLLKKHVPVLAMAERGGGSDPCDSRPVPIDGTCRRRAKSAMILMQCGICFQEFLLPAKRQKIR